MRTIPFILPDLSAIKRATGEQGYSYAIHNYYGHGPIAASKRARFRRALAMGARVDARRVIDMGCADGLLLPSLAAAYAQVAAIDADENFVARSRRLVESLELKNVQTLCNAGLPVENVKEKIGGGYQLMYLLETLEHVGRQPDMWSSKMDFLHDCFSLLDSGGQIVISVPKMVGLIVLFKNVLQRVMGLGHDPLTWSQLLRSAIWKDTDALEPLWAGHHVGFNHLKLDRHLEQSFVVHECVESVISVFYRLGRRSETAA